jgi:hypothetical protein
MEVLDFSSACWKCGGAGTLSQGPKKETRPCTVCGGGGAVKRTRKRHRSGDPAKKWSHYPGPPAARVGSELPGEDLCHLCGHWRIFQVTALCWPPWVRPITPSWIGRCVVLDRVGPLIGTLQTMWSQPGWQNKKHSDVPWLLRQYLTSDAASVGKRGCGGHGFAKSSVSPRLPGRLRRVDECVVAFIVNMCWDRGTRHTGVHGPTFRHVQRLWGSGHHSHRRSAGPGHPSRRNI